MLVREMTRNRPLLAITLAAFVVHAALATTWVAVPEDWDAQYYLLVARHIAQGRGAVVDGLWNLSVVPDTLPAPADLHWMPLPSRVLVPGVALLGDRGAQITSALIAASWAPLAWALARTADRDERDAATAAVLAATGGAWVHLCSTTDTYALYGLVGGLGLLSAARGALALTCGAAALAALSRNDGWLLGLVFAVSLVHSRPSARALVASAGFAATAAWLARSVLVGGPDAAQARALALSTTDYLDLYDGVLRSPASLLDRVVAMLGALGQIVSWWGALGLGVGVPSMFAGVARLRHLRWSSALAVWVALAPFIAVFAAPAVGAHGSVPRMLAAAMPLAAVWVAVGTRELGAWGVARRGYPEAFVPSAVFGGWFVVFLGLAASRVASPTTVPSPCDAVADLPPGPVFTSEPLAMELACGRAGVMVTRTVAPERLAALTARFHVVGLVIDPELNEGNVRREDLPRLLPGWTAHGAVVVVPP